jgi:hypothetical protein
MIEAFVIILVIDRLIKFFGYKILITTISLPINPCERSLHRALCVYKLTPSKFSIEASKLIWHLKFINYENK